MHTHTQSSIKHESEARAVAKMPGCVLCSLISETVPMVFYLIHQNEYLAIKFSKNVNIRTLHAFLVTFCVQSRLQQRKFSGV